MFTATLIASDRLAQGDVSALADRLAAAAVPSGQRWLAPGKACDLDFTGGAKAVRAALEDAIPGIDVIVQVSADRARKLLVADMDSTMIECECIDELADYAGIKPEIAAITERAMRGKLEFEAALKERVALLAGLKESVIEQALRERVRITPGAKELVAAVKRAGGQTVLVSGGFTRFAEPVAKEIGFDRVIANRLGIKDGVLDGTVEGEIVGAQTKRDTLLAVLAEKGWEAKDSLAIGDGANDIPMIEAAGLGVAYHAKPKTRAAADAAVSYGDLSALQFALDF